MEPVEFDLTRLSKDVPVETASPASPDTARHLALAEIDLELDDEDGEGLFLQPADDMPADLVLGWDEPMDI